MHVFGLTGGIGSGKSTIARRFRQRGLPVVDSDELAREVVAPGTPGLRAIVSAFGTGILHPSGALDRGALAAVVFEDDDARRRLNEIVHPLVRARTSERLATLAAASHPLACNEVPLLVEVGLADALRPLVVVVASESVRLARVMARDGRTEQQVRARMRTQLPLAQKAALADHVIDNDGPLTVAIAQADGVLDAVCSSCDIDATRYPR